MRMWKGSNDKDVGTVHELNAVEECHKVEPKTGWCSMVSVIILERVGRGRQPMALCACMGA
jgi:hypothetical protein